MSDDQQKYKELGRTFSEYVSDLCFSFGRVFPKYTYHIAPGLDRQINQELRQSSYGSTLADYYDRSGVITLFAVPHYTAAQLDPSFPPIQPPPISGLYCHDVRGMVIIVGNEGNLSAPDAASLRLYSLTSGHEILHTQQADILYRAREEITGYGQPMKNAFHVIKEAAAQAGEAILRNELAANDVGVKLGPEASFAQARAIFLRITESRSAAYDALNMTVSFEALNDMTLRQKKYPKTFFQRYVNPNGWVEETRVLPLQFVQHYIGSGIVRSFANVNGSNYLQNIL